MTSFNSFLTDEYQILLSVPELKQEIMSDKTCDPYVVPTNFVSEHYKTSLHIAIAELIFENNLTLIKTTNMFDYYKKTPITPIGKYNI